MTTIEHLRAIATLRPLRGRHPAVVVCLDDAAAFERHREELRGLDAELIVEDVPGQLSVRLGRPSVTVCDRFLDVALHAEDASPGEVVELVRWLEMRCEECPQSSVDMAARTVGDGWA